MTCTSKKEPLLHLHKCSTMDPDARRNVNLLTISAKVLDSMSHIKKCSAETENIFMFVPVNVLVVVHIHRLVEHKVVIQ